MKQIRVGRPVIVGKTTIIPLERVSIYHDSKEGRISVYTLKEPIGIVISSLQGKMALDICGEQVPLETYIQEVDGLQQVLDSLQSDPQCQS